MGDFPEVLSFDQLFIKLNWLICKWQPVLPVHWTDISISFYDLIKVGLFGGIYDLVAKNRLT
jgi:hypothetical protein